MRFNSFCSVTVYCGVWITIDTFATSTLLVSLAECTCDRLMINNNSPRIYPMAYHLLQVTLLRGNHLQKQIVSYHLES